MIVDRKMSLASIFRCGVAAWLGLHAWGYGLSVHTRGATPNVLIVIHDDQSWIDCSAYGKSSIATPAFDRVARAGVLFEHGYCSAPSCAPARAALLTGRNFWELEQGAFIQAWLPSKFRTLTERLDEANYQTGYTGKGWGPGLAEPSGKRASPTGKAWNRIEREPPQKGIGNYDYIKNFASFLEQKPKDKPFFFWVGVTEPHEPHDPENHLRLGLPLDAIQVPKFLPDTPGVRRSLANYLYEVQHADQTLGGLLEQLDQRGELDDTLVIVTADNGTSYPRSKTNVYDHGVHVPLAIMWPKRIQGGRVVSDFVGFADLAPTILEAVGLEIPAEMSGRSVLPELLSTASGRVDPTRDFIVNGIEWHGNLPPVDIAARMIRDDRYLYIVNYSDTPRLNLEAQDRRPASEYRENAETMNAYSLLAAHLDHPEMRRYNELFFSPRPREELYDLATDPDQIHNLANRLEFEDTKKKLQVRLEAFQRRTNDPRITGDMRLFQETLKFVEHRKSIGYRDRGSAAAK